MDIFEYLTGRGGLMVLGLIVIIVLLYNKIRARRYFKTSSKKKSK